MRLLFLAMLFLPAAAAAAESSAGRLVAERECGACHAVGMRGDSPLSDAPRFRDLKGRIDTRTLSQLLAVRMTEGHPRMPRLRIDPDELASLLAYWESLPAPERAALDAPARAWRSTHP